MNIDQINAWFDNQYDDSTWSIALFVNEFLLHNVTENDTYNEVRIKIMDKVNEVEKLYEDALIRLNPEACATMPSFRRLQHIDGSFSPLIFKYIKHLRQRSIYDQIMQDVMCMHVDILRAFKTITMNECK